jgi:hypothetical protein
MPAPSPSSHPTDVTGLLGEATLVEFTAVSRKTLAHSLLAPINAKLHRQ